ncbi:39S ribosomal protein L49, mitochondrial [Ornithorhynchus anatinus]|uniref:39S ribosomal protein L49, mitochondrial n=1 Tax=Ornithorhynchus anatinus TaxID=9258 RepID=UPI0010A7CD27|nr:39S ribosomal protein L49, mitochondrial [Ornithorhynchus anatinus]
MARSLSLASVWVRGGLRGRRGFGPGLPGGGPRSEAPGPPAASTSTYPGVVESESDYRFVERLIPPMAVPRPPPHPGYPTPSGWRPPSDPPPDLPYFIRRSRMHNVPVYTDVTHGNRQMTVIRKVEGDIWALQRDVEEFLSPLMGKTPVTQVNEMTGTLRIKGFWDQQLKDWLLEKGF